MKANETQSQPNNEPNGFTEIWAFPFGKITIRGGIHPKWSHLYCTSEEEYRKIEAEKIKEPEVETWRRSDRASGAIISNISPKKKHSRRSGRRAQILRRMANMRKCKKQKRRSAYFASARNVAYFRKHTKRQGITIHARIH